MIETGLSKIQGIKVVQSMHTPKSSLHALKSQKISYWLCVSFCSVFPFWAFCGAVVGCVCVFFGIIENQFGWNRKRTLLKFEHAGSQRFVCVLVHTLKPCVFRANTSKYFLSKRTKRYTRTSTQIHFHPFAAFLNVLIFNDTLL